MGDQYIEIALKEPNTSDIEKEALQRQEEEKKTREEQQENKKTWTTMPNDEKIRVQHQIDELKEEQTDTQNFLKRGKNAMNPPTGETLTTIEFSSEQKETPATLLEEMARYHEPLEIVRYMPEGKVGIGSHVSITFSHPMVPLESVIDPENVETNVIIEPKTKGTWRWAGTKTLIFDPTHRFSGSTKYKVTIPKGTKSALAHDDTYQMKDALPLEKEVSFTFETSPIRITENFPTSTTLLKPIFVIQLNQKINVVKAMDHVTISPAPTTKMKMVPLSKAKALEILEKSPKNNSFEKNRYEYTKYAVEQTVKDYCLIFQLNSKLKPNTSYKVTLDKKFPSMEGPLLNDEEQSFSFSTFSPLEAYIFEKRVAACYPVQVQFCNPIQWEALDPEHPEKLVTLEPTSKEFSLERVGECTLAVHGVNLANSKYKLTVHSQFIDVFNQKNKQKTFNLQTAPGYQYIQGPQNGKQFVHDASRDGPVVYPIQTQGIKKLKVSVFQMSINDYDTSRFGNQYKQPRKFFGLFTNYNPSPKDFVGSGKLVHQWEISVDVSTDLSANTDINVTNYLQYPNEKLGHLVLLIEPVDWALKYPPRVYTYLQSTRIGLDLFPHESNTTLCVSNLSDGTPQKVDNIYNNGKPTKFTLENESLGVYALPDVYYGANRVSCFLGKDWTFCHQITRPSAFKQTHYHHVLNDRGIYKPNETVYIKGYIRKANYSEKYVTLEIPKETFSINVVDSHWVKVTTVAVTPDDHGAYHFSFKLPDNINLGNCQFETDMPYLTHQFQVQEFRTPEYKVSINNTEPNMIIDSSALVKTKATYFSGEPLSGAKVKVVATQSMAFYHPPNHPEFDFGSSPPHWWYCKMPQPESTLPVTYENTTNSDGECLLSAIVKETTRDVKHPVTVNLAAEVQDLNQQTISASTSFLVHPCAYYVGIKVDKSMGRPNESFTFETCVVDIHGEPVSHVSVDIEMSHYVSKKKGFKVETEREFLFSKNVQPKHAFEHSLEASGQYQLVAKVSDNYGHTHSSSLYIQVYGDTMISTPTANKIEDVELVPNKKKYNLGEEAKILVKSPFPGATLLTAHYALSLRSIWGEQPIEFDEYGYALISVPIQKEYYPRVEVIVYIKGTFHNEVVNAYGSTMLSIDNPDYHLEVDIHVDEGNVVTPGSTIHIHGKVSRENKGLPANVCLYAVDEAILSLTDYHLNNPLKSFVTTDSCFIYPTSTRQYMTKKMENNNIGNNFTLKKKRGGRLRHRKSSGELPSSSFAGAISDDDDGVESKNYVSHSLNLQEQQQERQQPKIVIRSNFSANACFEAALETSNDGKFSYECKLPDSLTSYRIMAIAYADTLAFGTHEKQVTAKLPLNVRPSMPQFLNFGDEAALSVVFTNNTMKEQHVLVLAQFTNLKLKSDDAIKITMPPGGRVPATFQVETHSTGTARYQIAAMVEESGFSDAVRGEFPVYTPSTSESNATYGELDGSSSILQVVKPPTDVFNEVGGFEVTMRSTAVATLTEAFIYNYEYKFSCCEQIASRLLSIVALEDILVAFNQKNVPNKASLTASVGDALKELRKKQFTWGPSGGAFAFWNTCNLPDPFASLHATHALIRLGETDHHNHALYKTMVDQALKFVKHIDTFLKFPPFCFIPKDIKLAYQSYCYYLMALQQLQHPDASGDDLASRCAFWLKSINSFDEVSLESLAWIGLGLYATSSQPDQLKKICHFFANRVNETAETANFVTKYEDDGKAKLLLLHSNVRTDAIILEFLLHVDPNHSLNVKVLKGLMKARVNGCWGSTQENAFGLLAAKKYFSLFEKDTPDFNADIWFANVYMGNADFVGRSTNAQQLNIPMKMVVPDPDQAYETQPLILKKEGTGRLYYRMALHYAPRTLILKPLDRGFLVKRTYIDVSTGLTAPREQGQWNLTLGQVYRVKLTMVNASRRYHVALVDYLPAGFEAINPDLPIAAAQVQLANATPTSPSHPPSSWFSFRSRWYKHQNIRTERVEAFTDALWCGEHRYSYLARATTAGTFYAPPAKAEEMYSEEIFGRTGTDLVRIQ